MVGLGFRGLGFRVQGSGLTFPTSGGPPHLVIVVIMGNGDYVRVLLYSDYATITGWGVLLISTNE